MLLNGSETYLEVVERILQNMIIVEFYPSTSEDLLRKAIDWARTRCTVSEEEVAAILMARKSVLLHQGEEWTKKGVNFDVTMGSYDGAEACESFLYSEGTNWAKKGDVNFDIGMGAYHGAQACEIVGLFLLAQLKVLPNFEAILYRDDRQDHK